VPGAEFELGGQCGGTGERGAGKGAAEVEASIDLKAPVGEDLVEGALAMEEQLGLDAIHAGGVHEQLDHVIEEPVFDLGGVE